MAEFAKYLDDYMKEHQITSADLARETDIDRTVIYRYMKGTRIPSEYETVMKLAEALRMTVKEKQKLLEEYDRINMGDLVVDSFYQISGILSALQNVALQKRKIKTVWDNKKTWQSDHKVLTLGCKEDISACVIDLFEYALQQEKNGVTIYLLMQPVYEAVQRYLLPFFDGTNVKIEQIICIEQNLSKSYENLKIFEQSLLLCLGNIEYEVWYYYDYLNQHINAMTWMPNVLMVGDYVLQFNYDMTKGILVWDADYACGMREQYREHKKYTTPLMKKGDYCLDLFDLYHNTLQVGDKCLFFEPCLGKCISSDIFQEYLVDFPQKEILIEKMERITGSWSGMIYNPPKDCHTDLDISYFQKRGIQTFMETGRISEFPELLYLPLGKEKRLLVLKRVLSLVKQGRITYRMITDEIELPTSICIYINEENKRLCLNKVQADNISQIFVEEPGICHAFFSFFEYLEEKNMMLEEKETMEVLEGLYEEYAEKWG